MHPHTHTHSHTRTRTHLLSRGNLRSQQPSLHSHNPFSFLCLLLTFLSLFFLSLLFPSHTCSLSHLILFVSTSRSQNLTSLIRTLLPLSGISSIWLIKQSWQYSQFSLFSSPANPQVTSPSLLSLHYHLSFFFIRVSPLIRQHCLHPFCFIGLASSHTFLYLLVFLLPPRSSPHFLQISHFSRQKTTSSWNYRIWQRRLEWCA